MVENSRQLSLFTNPSRAWFGIWYPVILCVDALIMLRFPTNTVFITGAIVASAVAAVTTAAQLLTVYRELRFSWMLAAGLLLGYAVGTVNTALHIMNEGLTIADHAGRPQDQLSTALAVVLMVAGMLFSTGTFFEPPIKFYPERLEPGRGMGIVVFGILMILVAFA